MLIISTHRQNASSRSSAFGETRLLWMNAVDDDQRNLEAFPERNDRDAATINLENTQRRVESLFKDAPSQEEAEGGSGGASRMDMTDLLEEIDTLSRRSKQLVLQQVEVEQAITRLPDAERRINVWRHMQLCARDAMQDLAWLRGIVKGLTQWESGEISANALAAVIDAGTGGSSPPEMLRRADAAVKRHGDNGKIPLSDIDDEALRAEIRDDMEKAVNFDALAYNLQERVRSQYETIEATHEFAGSTLQAAQSDDGTRDRVASVLSADDGSADDQPAGVHVIPDGTFPVYDEENGEREGQEEQAPETAEVAESVFASQLLDKIRNMHTAIKELKNEQFTVERMVKSQFTDNKTRNELLDRWENGIKILTAAEGEMVWLEGFMNDMAKWENGELSPTEFITSIKGNILAGEAGKALSAQMDAAQAAHGNNASTPLREIADTQLRADVQAAIENSARYDDIKGYLSGELDEHSKVLEEANEFADQIKLNQKKQDARGGKSRNLLGIEFYSVNNFINMAKLLGEGLKSGWDKRQRRKEAAGAQSIARVFGWIPYGQEMNINLDQKVDSQNDEEKNDFKKTLDEIDFDQVPQLLESNNANPNHFLAILEAAASHGWLYDLDVQSRTVFGRQIIFPDTWNTTRCGNYVVNLDTQNRRGENEERQRGQDRVGSLESIPPIITVLKNELASRNYWATIGILKTMIDKAKTGHTIEWFTTTLLSHLRKDPQARKILAPAIDNLMDQAGNMTLAHLAGLTVNNLKIERTKVARIMYSDNFERDGKRGGGGFIIQNVLRIEDEIEQKLGGRPPQDELDILVARVMAGQTVTLENGKVMSVYDEKYNNLRQRVRTAPMNPDIKNIDDDYFNEESGAILVNNEAFRTIFALSSGELTNGTKPLMISEQIFKRQNKLIELRNNARSDEERQRYNAMLENFTTELRDRFNNHIQQSANDGRAGKFAVAERLGNLPEKDKYLLVELVKRGLLDKKVAMRVTSFSGGKDFGQGLLNLLLSQQMLNPQHDLLTFDDLMTMKVMAARGEADKGVFRDLVNNAYSRGVLTDRGQVKTLLADMPRPASGQQRGGSASASAPNALAA